MINVLYEYYIKYYFIIKKFFQNHSTFILFILELPEEERKKFAEELEKQKEKHKQHEPVKLINFNFLYKKHLYVQKKFYFMIYFMFKFIFLSNYDLIIKFINIFYFHAKMCSKK